MMKLTSTAVIAGLLLAGLLVFADASAASEDTLTNINTAAVAELAGLNGLGEVKAKAIVEYREQHGAFKSVDDLDQVKGIGPQLLTRLRPQVTIGAAAPAPAAAAAPAAPAAAMPPASAKR